MRPENLRRNRHFWPPRLTRLPTGLRWSQPAVLLATWFGVGLIRPAAGSFGSAAAVPFLLLLAWVGGVASLAAAVTLLFALGWWSSSLYARVSRESDPSSVVIDEVFGLALVMTMIPATATAWIAGFLLFRFFDILKPFPIGWCDRHLKGGFGIMFDDGLAALLAIACVWGIWSSLLMD
ncbi:MAG: phosphatidylglycerophosphatase A [Alphaproteobacteria bacterium]|nr:phosphatidylglycerophosphatase A [Alphaproteobacteria bacterium]